MAFILLGFLSAAAAESPGGAGQQDEMRQRRRAAAHRQRRVIFNNDGNEAVYFPADLKPTPENVLALRTTPLVDSHVDAIFYCTNRAFGTYLHRTKLGEVLTGETRAKQG